MLGLLHAVFADIGNTQRFNICYNFRRMIFRYSYQRNAVPRH